MELMQSACSYLLFDILWLYWALLVAGSWMGSQLGKSKIQTTVIADSAIFAIMSQVNKVIIGMHKLWPMVACKQSVEATLLSWLLNIIQCL